MFDSGRRQILVYVVVAASVLLLGLNSLGGSGPEGDPSIESANAAGGAAGSAEAAGTASGSEGGDFEISQKSSRLVVDVSGGVKDPGVYRLAEGSRVIDAIRIAGGPRKGAMPWAINRAAMLADGQQVVVPLSAGSGSSDSATTSAGSGSPDTPISLGSATQEQLEGIDGIGPVTAAGILEFRDSKGGLSSVDELDQVSGIGPVTMEALRSSLMP